MTNKRKVIGEGSYGCVHQPSIHCDEYTKKLNYNKYVSKIMMTDDAVKELNEFVIIDKYDSKGEYHLGTPILCKPKLDEEVIEEIKNCEHIDINDLKNNPNEYSLLVQKFGGYDLKQFCTEHLEEYLEKDKENKTDNFWLQVHRLIKGLRFFKTYGIIHNDIKPGNILFDPKTQEMKYIDFGLMRTKQMVISSSYETNNYLGAFHWSFPLECGFMNKYLYDKYKKCNDEERIKYKDSLYNIIICSSKLNPYNLPINNPEYFKIVFTYVNPELNVPNSVTQLGYIKTFFEGFNKIVNNYNYRDVLNYIADSIDVYALGFTLQFVASCFKKTNALSLEHFTRLSAFFYKMYDFNPKNRIIDINSLLNEYENILLEIGVLTRLNKSFKNNNIINKNFVPLKIISKHISKNLSKSLEKLEYEDIIITRCPEGKEINPKTNRCQKTKKTKICPDGKEINPKTNRCVQNCKEGYERNKNFRCQKTKKTKICPHEKEINPKTNRCVKKM